MNYEQVDELLKSARPTMELVLSTNGIEGYHLEDWPRENPALEAQWRSASEPGLMKSIAILVTKGDTLPFRIRVDGNAWYDSGGIRRANYVSGAEIDVRELVETETWARDLKSKLSHVIRKVEALGMHDLNRTSEIAVLA